MNFYSETNNEVRQAVLSLLGEGFENAKRINFSISYSQNRKLSIVTIEISPSALIHGLIFFYTRGLKLYDAIVYRNKRFARLNRSGDSLQRIDRINRFLLDKLPNYSPVALKKIKETASGDDDAKDLQIQRLKDRLEITTATNRSLRNQIKALRARSG